MLPSVFEGESEALKRRVQARLWSDVNCPPWTFIVIQERLKMAYGCTKSSHVAVVAGKL